MSNKDHLNSRCLVFSSLFLLVVSLLKYLPHHAVLRLWIQIKSAGILSHFWMQTAKLNEVRRSNFDKKRFSWCESAFLMFTFHSPCSQQKYLQLKKERWTRRKREIAINKDKTRDTNKGGERQKLMLRRRIWRKWDNKPEEKIKRRK